MKIIRQNSFETNSSSTHALSLENMLQEWDTSWELTFERKYIIPRKEYGWEFERYNTLNDKVPYIAMLVHADEIKRDWLEEILMEETGAKEIVWSLLSLNGFIDSYIDHIGEAKGIDVVLKTKETMRNFLFNKFSWLILGNDNCAHHPNWNEAPHIFRQKEYYMSLEDCHGTDGFFFDGPLTGKTFYEKLDAYLEYMLSDKRDEIHKRHKNNHERFGVYDICWKYCINPPEKYHIPTKKTYKKNKDVGLIVPIVWVYEHYQKKAIELEKEEIRVYVSENQLRNFRDNQLLF